MRLTVVGCSGSYPGPESPASCYLLEAEHQGRTWRLLLDLGSGALGALHRYVDPAMVDGVVLSHLHADHCLDLCGFYVLRKYHPTGIQPQIPVWGPEGTAVRMAKAYDLDEDPGMSAEFDFRAHVAGDLHFGPFTIRTHRVVHPVTAYAVRVTAGGRTLAYSGDSGECTGLVEAAHNADLFLCEASFVEGEENPPDLHLTGRQAAAAATKAGARRLLLTHIPPWHDPQVVLSEASSYDGPAELAVCGRTYEV
jgi:ribonuclease BN (tRNA processing enzyme)